CLLRLTSLLRVYYPYYSNLITKVKNFNRRGVGDRLTPFLLEKEIVRVELQLQIAKVEYICRLIENEKEYLGELTGYLPILNETMVYILNCAQDPNIPFMINEQFVLQVLKDVLYGIEHQDSVFLLDTLRYGLLEIYCYGKKELQSEERK
ncbi:MAG: hypothetical protein NC307_12505, partial [Roseburia sp.]|nr:hypothetical protein [Roseburia sp.]